jgi:hypothetical protein
VRRDRIYRLTLVAPDGANVVLSELRFEPRAPVPSQRVYRASPGGRWLAYESSTGALRLRDAQGHDHGVAPAFADFRFSADGRWLAVASAPPQKSDTSELLLIDLSGPTPQTRWLATLSSITRLEWSANGILVEQQHPQRLRLVATTGAQHLVYEGDFTGFASAARGHRAVLVSPGKVRDFDLAQPAQPPRVVASERARSLDLVYAEMSADGNQVLLADRSELLTLDKKGQLRQERAFVVSTIWPADDGARMLWVDSDGVHLGDGTAPVRLRGDFKSARFRRDQPGLVGALGGDAVLWDAEGQNGHVAWHAQDEEIIGADSFAGGVVVWTARDPFDILQPRF